MRKKYKLQKKMQNIFIQQTNYLQFAGKPQIQNKNTKKFTRHVTNQVKNRPIFRLCHHLLKNKQKQLKSFVYLFSAS